MIPNRIHFIFGLAADFGGKPFSFVHYLAIRSAAEVNRPDEIVMHYAHQPDGVWWEAAKPFLTLNRVSPPTQIYGRQITHFAHQSDILRLELLHREGGIYLDADIFCIRSLEPLRGYSAVMGMEPNQGLCNAVILAERDSEFIGRWLEQYRTFKKARWTSHSVRLPFRLAAEHPDMVHVEDEYSFFFPTYFDPMYLWLWRAHLSPFHRAIGLLKGLALSRFYLCGNEPVTIAPFLSHALASKEWYYQKLRKAYCIHLWESFWFKRFLQGLDPATVRKREGLFARLVTEVLPEFSEQPESPSSAHA
jgi:hypothetical protein